MLGNLFGTVFKWERESYAGLVISFNLVRIICRSLIICANPDVKNFTGAAQRHTKKVYTLYMYI